MEEEIKQSMWQDGRGANSDLSPFKVLGAVEKWVVMRRKGAMPILAHINSFGEGKEYKKVIRRDEK